MAAVLVCPDGDFKEVKPAKGKQFKLEELQEMVEGYIEILPCNDGTMMVVNEEDRLKGLPINEIASSWIGYPIVGNAVICTSGEIE